MSGEPSSWRHKISEQAGDGLTIEVWEIARKACRPAGPELGEPALSGLAAIRIVHAATVPVPYRQICLRLADGSVLLEPGAFQYARGSITAELHKPANAGSRVARRAATAATNDTAYATRFSGSGEIWTAPSEMHFVTVALAGPQDALVLDAQAFCACEGSVEVSAHVHGSVQGLLSGNGIMRSKLSGRGVAVMQCPVPPSEIDVIALDGRDELMIDGDLMLAHSASLEVTLQPLVRGTPAAMRSAEGLVYTVRGHGKVLLMPTRSLGY